MNTYVLTINETLTVVADGSDRRTVVTKAAKSLGVEIKCFNGKQATQKAVREALANGARDLRSPKIATNGFRRSLGTLVGM